MEKSLHFPDYFPPGCPPEEATDEERLLFRLCKNKVPCEGDFISYYLENPKKYKDRINAYGLSVLASEEACRKMMDAIPGLRKKYSCIASGMTNSNRGRILETPGISPEHITWWVYEGVKPHTFFEVCTGRANNDE